MKLFGSGGSHTGKGGHTGEPKKVFTIEDEAPEEIVKAGMDSESAAEEQAVPVQTAEPAITPETPMETAPNKKKRNVKKTIIIVACVVVALIAAAIIAYSIWEKPPEIAQNGPHVVVTEAPVQETETPAPGEESPKTSEAPEPTDSPEPTESPEPVESTRKEGCYTFLLAAYDQVGSNTDTIIVGRLDTKGSTLNLVSIPRDTYVNVPWNVKKLNSVLAVYGNDVDKFKAEIAKIIGFDVDFYAVVDMVAVEKLIDCIGGVDYNVPINMNYDDPTQDLHIHINKGSQHLNGSQAVHVLRFRQGNGGTGYPDGDLGRIKTQQSFIMSVASQMLKLGNIPNLGKAIDIFTEYVDTDLTANNIAYIAREFLKLDSKEITMATAPGYGASIDDISYLMIEKTPWLEIVNEKLNPYVDDITLENINIIS